MRLFGWPILAASPSESVSINTPQRSSSSSFLLWITILLILTAYNLISVPSVEHRIDRTLTGNHAFSAKRETQPSAYCFDDRKCTAPGDVSVRYGDEAIIRTGFCFCLWYLHNLITVQPPRSIRSSSLITLARPSMSSLRITDRSFQYAFLRLWSQLPASISINHALISPILTPPVLWVALPPSLPLTRHTRHSLPPHSFIPGLKPFSANPSHRSLPFLLQY